MSESKISISIGIGNLLNYMNLENKSDEDYIIDFNEATNIIHKLVTNNTDINNFRFSYENKYELLYKKKEIFYEWEKRRDEDILICLYKMASFSIHMILKSLDTNVPPKRVILLKLIQLPSLCYFCYPGNDVIYRLLKTLKFAREYILKEFNQIDEHKTIAKMILDLFSVRKKYSYENIDCEDTSSDTDSETDVDLN